MYSLPKEPQTFIRRHLECGEMAFELAGRIGTRFLRISVGIGVSGLFIYKTVPHAFPVSICKSVFGAEGEQVPEKCRTEFLERARKMGLDNAEKVSLFVNKSFSGFHAGATWFPNGAVLGIPGWFGFNNEEDVINSPINFKGRTIKWESELGNQMKNSLTPSQDSIAFTIGHEVAHIQHPEYKLLCSILPSTWLYATYKGISLTPRVAKIPLLLDLLLKLCILRLSYLGYKYVSSEIHFKEEFLADELSAKADLKAARGGIEAMTKRLQLNQVLRALHGSNGEHYYDADGNELKSGSHPKLTERLSRLQIIVDEHLKSSS